MVGNLKVDENIEQWLCEVGFQQNLGLYGILKVVN